MPRRKNTINKTFLIFSRKKHREILRFIKKFSKRIERLLKREKRVLLKKLSLSIRSIKKKLKPAHTLADVKVTTDDTLNTTSTIAQFIGDARNWETGNISGNTIITSEIDTSEILDLAGAITIASGTSLS